MEMLWALLGFCAALGPAFLVGKAASKCFHSTLRANSNYMEYGVLWKIQRENRQWAERNFGNKPSWQPLLGVQEEVGELSHAYLKRAQGIRGTTEKHNADIRDAVADIVIFLMDFCNKEGIDLQSEVVQTWEKVQKRDWKANPEGKGV